MALYHIHQGLPATVAAVAAASAALTFTATGLGLPATLCPAPFCALAAAALTATTPARSSCLDRWHVALAATTAVWHRWLRRRQLLLCRHL